MRALLIMIASLLAATAVAQPQNQAVPAFSAIQHPEPLPVDRLTLSASPSYNFSTETVAATTSLAITPDWNSFTRNAVFGVSGPTGFIQDREEGLDTTFALDWQQRWINEAPVTLATRTKLLLPTDESRNSIDVRLVGIVSRNLGDGVVYLNGIYESEGDVDGSGIFLATAGYKHQLGPGFSLHGDITYEEEGSLFFGTSASMQWGDFIFGPGIQVEVDTVSGNTSVTGGALLLYFF